MENNITFSNNNMHNSVLPQIEQLNFIALSPVYKRTNATINVCVFILFVSLFIAVNYQEFFDISAEPKKVTLILLAILSFFTGYISIFQWFADGKKSYALREQDLSYASGLVFKKTITQPLLRIQHIELKRGPIERKVGLAKIQVYSAGGAMHTLEVPGLTIEIAESIREFILQHKDVNNDG